MERLSTDKAPAAIGPYSQAMKVCDFLFLSGQLGLDPVTMKLAGEDIETQTRQVFSNMTEILRAAGIDLSNVVKVTVFLYSMEHFKAVNALYAEAFGEHKPARSAVQVARLPMDALIEIEAIAICKE
ncbi:MAG: RidA family protein [Chloroflexota bacterium]|nr:RidA family protein [Chloroflexota bacterium]